MKNKLYPIGEAPPLGEVPSDMYAFTVRRERFGPPKDSMQLEVVPVPEIGADEVLVYVMAAGVNYNNIWAGQGVPLDVIGMRQNAGEEVDFHIGGSDASGIVYKVGKNVRTPRVGDEVVMHCGTWDAECPVVKDGVDPMFSPTFKIWGYDRNWGSFAQFTKVQAHQCMPRPQHLSWEASAAYMLVGATAYRMLYGFPPNIVKKGEPVLIWGGAGGLGSMAIQICRSVGAIPIAVVSENSKFQYCMDLGAKGCINRNDFSHWGMLPHWSDKPGYDSWMSGVRAFGSAFWKVLGEKRAPTIVFEHPGEMTIPTSLFQCSSGGMVVTCAGTSGYNGTVDVRYLWTRQKRLQGSHFANDVQAKCFNDLVMDGKVDPCLSRTFEFKEVPLAHQMMFENVHPLGNMAILVGAPSRGLGKRTSLPDAAHEAQAAQAIREIPAVHETHDAHETPEAEVLPA